MAIKETFRNLPRFDWVIFFSYLALVVIGLMMVYTTTYHDNTDNSMWSMSSAFGKQLLWAGVAVLLLFSAYLIDWQLWNTLSLPIYVIGIFVLILLLFVGTEIKGATSWIVVGPFSIQPSEFVKFTTAVYLASLLSAIRFNLNDVKTQLFVFAVIFVPAALIIIQPDPGSAITFGSLIILLYRRGLPTGFVIALIGIFLTLVLSLVYGFVLASSIIFLLCLLFILNFQKTRLLSILVIVTLLLTNILTYQYGYELASLILNAGVSMYFLFYYNRKRTYQEKFSLAGGLLVLCFIAFGSSYAFNNVLKPHQQDRINVWLQPEKCDPRGSLYNLIQSKMAISSGGLAGKGYLNGNFTKLNYVPEQTTDFIFSSIGEEQGFVGATGVIVLFLVLIMRLIQRGEDSKHLFVKNYAYAIAGFIFLHFFINIGMTIGISPVIGIPLPFISKGGSALMAFSIMIGVALKMFKGR
jgi:rod shape determining protein RodA